MTTAVTDENEIIEEEDEDDGPLFGGPDTVYEDVFAFLSQVHDPQSYFGNRCDERIEVFLEQLQYDCMFDDEETYDSELYVSHVEQLLKHLYRHFMLLLSTEYNSQMQQSNTNSEKAFSPWKNYMVRRMMIYVITGNDVKSSYSQERFSSVDEFENCLMAHRLLPPELRPRAAQFIEVYSTNFFETEHKGLKL